MDPIIESIRALDSSGEPGAKRHLAAWMNPQGYELPIYHLIRGLAQYGAAAMTAHGSKIGDDQVLGPALKNIADSILTLLNGDIGRFDGGTLDKLVRAICVEYGVELDP